jgi:hypothetical protein
LGFSHFPILCFAEFLIFFGGFYFDSGPKSVRSLVFFTNVGRLAPKLALIVKILDLTSGQVMHVRGHAQHF